MNQKLAPIVVQVANPIAFSGQGSIIMFRRADEAVAINVARRIARETGRADKAVIETIPADSTH